MVVEFRTANGAVAHLEFMLAARAPDRLHVRGEMRAATTYICGDLLESVEGHGLSSLSACLTFYPSWSFIAFVRHTGVAILNSLAGERLGGVRLQTGRCDENK